MKMLVLADDTNALDVSMSDIYSTLQHFLAMDAIWIEGLSTRILKTEFTETHFKTYTEAKYDKSWYRRFDLIFGVSDDILNAMRGMEIDCGKFSNQDPGKVIYYIDTSIRNEENRKYQMIIDDILKRRRWL